MMLVTLAIAPPSSRHLDVPPDTIIELDREFVNGSNIALDSLSAVQLENLVVLAKVWGFLKYHHPRVTSGAVQWDFELFRVLASVLAASDASERNAALLGWIEQLGDVPQCDPCASPPSDAHLLPPIAWIRDEQLLGVELSRALQHVWANRPTGQQFWVRIPFPGAGNVNLSREPAYADLEHVDAGYRILAAFRLWNVIEYWFPYRDQIEEDWDGVLRELLPVFVEARTHADYERALVLLIARVHDTHANIWSGLDSRPPSGTCALPATLRFLDGQVVVAGVRRRPTTELRMGDVLLALDGRPIDELIEEWRPYYAASNEPTRLRDIASVLSLGECGRCSAVIDRAGQRLELELRRVAGAGHHEGLPTHDRRGDSFQWLGDQVAYLKLSTVYAEDVRGYIEEAADARGLVIDIRNYPNEFVVFALGQHLVETPTPFARFTMPDLANPGAFTWTESLHLFPQAPTTTAR